VTGFTILLSGSGIPNGSGLINLLGARGRRYDPADQSRSHERHLRARPTTVSLRSGDGPVPAWGSHVHQFRILQQLRREPIRMTAAAARARVIANQSGNTTYAVAPTADANHDATLATQTITFTTSAPASAAYGTHFTVAHRRRERQFSGLHQRWIVQQFWRDLHDDERAETCS